jgi:hypothetical protein
MMTNDTFLALEAIRTGTIDQIRSSALIPADRVALAVAYEQFYANYLQRLIAQPAPV